MSQNQTPNKPFTPLKFLASLGAGGVAVMPFAFFQYTHHTGKGLISWAKMGHGSLPLSQELLFYSLETIMILFAVLHFGLTTRYLGQLVKWIKSDAYSGFIADPLKNAAILAPFVSLGMSFNLIIGPIRFFVPWMADNLQLLMLPALIGWAVLWFTLVRMEIKLLNISFLRDFDINKINFGWLLHPFALGMTTVVGTGIAAMAKNPNIAHTAAFMAVITMVMGLFLLLVKTVALFTSHFNAKGLPAKQFLPSLLIVIPNITLYAIAAFRFVHYFEKQFGAHMHWVGQIIIIMAMAFEVWYMAFGISMLRSYFKDHVFRQSFHVSQWGLICPFVAVGVLGGFFYKLFVPNPVSYTVAVAAIFIAASGYLLLYIKSLRCAYITKHNQSHDCSRGLTATT